eukprot:UN30138
MTPLSVGKNVKLCEQGEGNDNFFVVAKGSFSVFRVNVKGRKDLIRTLRRGNTFGTLSLVYNVHCEETVVANDSARVWCVPRYDFKRIIIKTSDIKKNEIANFLKGVRLFHGLLNSERQKLADVLDEIYYDNKDMILKQGEKNDNLYIIRAGCAVVTVKDDSNREHKVCRLGAWRHIWRTVVSSSNSFKKDCSCYWWTYNLFDG